MKQLINNLKISHVFVFMNILAIVIIGVLSYHNLSNVSKSKDFLLSLKNDRIDPINQLYIINEEYAINIVDAANKANNHAINWEEAALQIKTSRANLEKKWELFSSSVKNEGLKNKVQMVSLLTRKADLVLDSLNYFLLIQDQAGVTEIVQTKLYPVIEPITVAIRQINNEAKEGIIGLSEESEKLHKTAYIETFSLGLVTITIITLLSLFIVRKMSHSLKKANESIKKISEGDLTVKITGYGKDEIGELMFNIKGLVRNLRSIMELINSAANNIAMTSHELSTNSQQISEGATEQAASVEQIAASMEEISSNIIQNSKNSNITEQISSQAGAEFESGRENIDTTVNAIQTIASKISIIGEIAFQTNILALNAAVEAARAGEHGRGFGVVAAEVGKLAERSKIAAAEINALSISGVDLSLKSKELLKIALPSINKTIKLVKEISLASSEQSAGVNQINSGIQTLNHVTQQNAAASEEMATVAEELSAQAEQLTNSISFFNMGNGNQTTQKKKPTPKYLEKETKFTQAKRNKAKGIDFDMRSNDDLDDEFETF